MQAIPALGKLMDCLLRMLLRLAECPASIHSQQGHRPISFCPIIESTPAACRGADIEGRRRPNWAQYTGCTAWFLHGIGPAMRGIHTLSP